MKTFSVMRNMVAVLLVLVADLTAHSSLTDSNSVQTGRIDRYVREEMQRQKVPGVAIAVLEGAENYE